MGKLDSGEASLTYVTNCHACSALTSPLCLQVRGLELANNQLTGTVPYSPFAQFLDCSSNYFTELTALSSNLQVLYVANNSLSGNIVQLMSQLASEPNSALRLLDLSYNNLSGSLPPDMPPSLSILNISNNAFFGSLPSSWGTLQNMTVLRLDNNDLTGALPPAWSAWGNNTGNSLQLSITDTSLHGRIPREWIQQFCLAIVRNNTARLLFEPIIVELTFSVLQLVGPRIELPAQQASINVTLAGQDYTFDYNNPDSVCGIAHAARNTALLWGMFAAVLIAVVICICLWQRFKPKAGPQSGWFSRWNVSTVLSHVKLSFGRRVANRVWFLVSDVGWTIYDQVTDAITIHQVFSSGQLVYAYILLAILLVPFAITFILVVTVSIRRCQSMVAGRSVMRQAVALLIVLLLAPLLFIGLELVLIIHGVGVPLPLWWGYLGIDLVTLYRLQSVAEATFSALPQAIVQSRLYLMGNDPNGVQVYIDTNLFLVSMVGSLFSILKTVALVAIEVHQYKCSLLEYFIKLVKFETFHSVP